MAPVARLAIAGLGGPPTYANLSSWTAASRAGTPLAAIADEVVAKAAFVARYGGLGTGAFVEKIYADVAGRAPTAASRALWVGRLDAATHSRADLLAALAVTADAVRRFAPKVNVLMTYAGLLRRAPDSSGWAYWVPKVQAGTSVGTLVGQFFTSSEYRRRFGWP